MHTLQHMSAVNNPPRAHEMDVQNAHQSQLYSAEIMDVAYVRMTSDFAEVPLSDHQTVNE